MTTNTRTQKLRDAIPDTPAPTGGEQPSGTVAKRPDPAKDLLLSMEEEFAKVLPDVLPPDMFARIALSGFRKTPKLLECTRTSLLGALMECARLGLAPCTEQSTLSPFRNTKRNIIECQLVIGYQGYVQLMYRSGQVNQVVAELVYEADEWEYSTGDGGRFFHKPKILLPPDKRGPAIFAYAYATLVGGGRTNVAITPRWKAEQLQKKYGNVWLSDFEAMWLKTPLRQVQKFAPKSSELRRAVLSDGATFDLGGVVDRSSVDGDDIGVEVRETEGGGDDWPKPATIPNDEGGSSGGA